jgi:signal transduction histidine kinase
MQDLNRILALRTPVHETREPLRLSDLWKQVQDSLKIQLAGCQASVQGDFSAIDEILGVRSYLQNILHTLLSNAIKYRNPQRPLHIRLSAEVSQGQVVIVFQDNGLGIDLKRYGNKLFGLYKRFHPHIPGRGLKLHLAKTEIEALGGSIRVESAPDQGACFCVMLPLPPLIGG